MVEIKKILKSLPTVIEDGETVLAPKVLEEIMSALFANLQTRSDYQRSYKSSSWLEPDDPAQMDVEAWGSLSFEEIRKMGYIVDDNAIDLMEDAFYNADCYDFYEELTGGLIEEIESGIPTYRIEEYSLDIKVNKEKEKIFFTVDIGWYEFDEDEYIEAFRPEPDPYDCW